MSWHHIPTATAHQFYKRKCLFVANQGHCASLAIKSLTSTTVVGVASMRNIALGGASSSGSWGQAGGGGSIANSQLVTNIQLRSCGWAPLSATAHHLCS